MFKFHSFLFSLLRFASLNQVPHYNWLIHEIIGHLLKISYVSPVLSHRSTYICILYLMNRTCHFSNSPAQCLHVVEHSHHFIQCVLLSPILLVSW